MIDTGIGMRASAPLLMEMSLKRLIQMRHGLSRYARHMRELREQEQDES